jgi:hypothetical protein
MPAITLSDWKRGAGLAGDEWTHRRERDGCVEIYWPGQLDGRDGWWWAIGTADEMFLAGGWAAGSVRDRNVDIARAIVRFAPAPARVS